MLKRALTPICLGVMLVAGSMVAPTFLGHDAAYAQALTPQQQQAAIVRIQQAINANRNNPAALAAALSSLVASTPSLAGLVDQAVAGVNNISPAMASAIGQGMAQAVNTLLLAGNTTAAAAVNAEVAQVQAAIASNPTNSPGASAAVSTSYTTTASQAIAADTNAGTAQGAAAATAFASLLSAGSSSGGGSSSRT